MASPPTADEVCEKLRQYLQTQLRDEYPYLKQGALNEMVSASIDNLHASIKQQEPVMAASKSRISFFSLSAELRNQIYSLALHNDNTEIYLERGYYHYPDGGYSYNTWTYPIPPLLKTCKQIRAEALPMFWATRLLRLDVSQNANEEAPGLCYDVDQDAARKLMKMGPAQLTLIKEVHLEVQLRHGLVPLSSADERDMMGQLNLTWYGLNPAVLKVFM